LHIWESCLLFFFFLFFSFCLFNFKFVCTLCALFCFPLFSGFCFLLATFFGQATLKQLHRHFPFKISRKTMTKFILVFAVLESETKVKHLRNKSNNKQMFLTTLLLLFLFVCVVAFVLTGQTSSGGFCLCQKMSD